MVVIFNASFRELNPIESGKTGGSYCHPIYNALHSPDSSEGNSHVASIGDLLIIEYPLNFTCNYSNATIDEFLYTSEVSLTAFAPYGLISTTVTEPIYMAQLT